MLSICERQSRLPFTTRGRVGPWPAAASVSSRAVANRRSFAQGRASVQFLLFFGVKNERCRAEFSGDMQSSPLPKFVLR
jgi:hypothetical protein